MAYLQSHVSLATCPGPSMPHSNKASGVAINNQDMHLEDAAEAETTSMLPR